MKRTGLTRRGWPRGKSARQLVKRDELDAITPALIERAGGVCEICRAAWGTHRHHVLRRSQGGTNTLKDLLLLCGECHSHVHANPELAYEMGWLRKGT